jgi:glyceraldehyde 3-phosphate dehydrogenase
MKHLDIEHSCSPDGARVTKVAINGMGRIGRAVLKVLFDEPGLELVAVNDLLPAEQLAYLLKFDSVYGRFVKDVRPSAGRLQVAEKEVQVFAEKDPARLPWMSLGADIVFECTGRFTDREGMSGHLRAGAHHVLLSAQSKSDDIPTVVYGVNSPGREDNLVSCASCTTNCITPVVEVMGRRIGTRKIAFTTVHAYTASQNIVDGPAGKWRRGRAGAANLVPTDTGAARATIRALPEYRDRFDGIAIRAPVPSGSLSDMVFLTERETTEDEVKAMFREESQTTRYAGVLGVSDEEIVSSDIVGDPRASIVDLKMTQVIDGDLVKILSWYDNEWGYASQMVRVAGYLATTG